MDSLNFRKKNNAKITNFNEGLFKARELYKNGEYNNAFDLYEELLYMTNIDEVLIISEIYNNLNNLPNKDRYNIYQSRIFDFNIEEGEKVLDIGSGHVPFPLATHLADITIDNHSYGRAGVPFKYIENKPVYEINIEDMPFADKEFDFIYCSHVLEHVNDPEKACKELMRVGKRGYIETPKYFKDLIFNWAKTSNHIWKVEYENQILKFNKYNELELEGLKSDIFRYMLLDPKTEREKSFYTLSHLKPLFFNNMFIWEDSFNFEIEKKKNINFQNDSNSYKKNNLNKMVNQEKEYHGTEYGGWTLAPELINSESIIYSFGIGEDISFDLSLIKKYGVRIFAFDPTPKSLNWLKRQHLPQNFNYYDYGIAKSNGFVKFYPPENPEHVSHTLLYRSKTADNYIEVPVKSLKTIMSELGHSEIDILKMDIEGAEYEVIDHIIENNIHISQLLVEFHDRFEGVESDKSQLYIKKLNNFGYYIFNISKTGLEYSFIKKELVLNIFNEIPVILITYNRPWHTNQVLTALKKHNIQNLFIYSDAPKTEKDIDGVIETRKLIQSIDWTKPTLVYQKQNQGLAKSIISAVNEIFETYDRLILLEDDCVPKEYFFDFMSRCLAKYEENKSVFGISGYSVQLSNEVLANYNYDLYFCPRIGSWGWATWKDRWEKRNEDLLFLKREIERRGIDISQGGNDILIMLEQMLSGKLKDVWTMHWLLTVYLNKGYYIYPTKSHIENIGFDGTGVHCGASKKYETVFSIASPKNFPVSVFVNEKISRNFKNYYNIDADFKHNLKKADHDLKVVHICMQDFGGAGNAAYRLHKGLLTLGVDSQMLVFSKESGDPTVKVLPEVFGNTDLSCIDILRHQSNELNNLWKRWWQINSIYPKRPKGLELFSDTYTNIDLLKLKDIQEADIINLHWVAGMINYDRFAELCNQKNVIWTLHDMNAFTGGCHYNNGCLKYHSQCCSCPQLGSDEFKDLSYLSWITKELAYKKSNLSIVTPSQWLANCAKKSKLFSRFDINVIPNGLQLDIFRPNIKESVYASYNIPVGKKLILFVADQIDNKRKGVEYLINALKSNLVSLFNDDVVLGLVGSNSESILKEIEYNYVSFGKILDGNEMAKIYSSADVFVIPSLEDNLPNTVLEALACGTPVVGFNIGGISDMIDHQVNGYLCNEISSECLASGISWVLANTDDTMRNSCRRSAEKKYDVVIQAKRYLEEYKRIIKKQTKNNGFVIKNKQDYPKISVVTPSYNQAEYLEETIKSVLNQQYPNLEYVIIDGGSTDGSVGIIKKYSSQLKYWHSKPDSGQYFAINEGFKHTDGEIMAWINSDDKFHPRSLFKVAEVFKSNQNIEWICGRPTYMESDGSIYDIHNPLPVWNRERYLEMKYDSPFIQQESTFWKRSLWEKAGAELNTNYSLAADLELWVRFFRLTSLYTLDAFVGAWRRHVSQKSNILRKKYIEEAEQIINNESKNFPGRIIQTPPKDRLKIKYNLGKDPRELQKLFDHEYEENCWNNYRAELFKNFKDALIKSNIEIVEFIFREQNIPPQKNTLSFSIITPSFNQGNFLEQTIKSVLKQNYPLYEYIVIDGGSDDCSVEIIKRYERYINYWVSEKDNGQADALNKGFKLATGDIIGWINSDDWYEENTFEQVNKFFVENPDKNIVMGNCNLIDENGKIFNVVVNSERGFEELSKYWIGKSIPTQPAIFFRKSLLDKYGMLDETLHYGMDFDLWMRFAQQNRFYHINEVFANYRFHTQAKGGDQNWEKFVPEWKMIREKYINNRVPLISVIIPCYNYGRYLTEAVESVVNQTYRNFEIIIVNDGSTDNTKEVAEGLIKKYNDTQIKLINQKNSGHPSVSRNNGIKEARGKYILPLDADDKLSLNALEKYVIEAEKTGGDFVIFGWLQQFGVVNTIWNAYSFENNHLLRRNMVPASSMFTKTIWIKNNGYKTIGYEDWEFWINALANGATFINISAVLTHYRTTNENSRVKDLIAKHEKHVAEIILEHKNLYEDSEIAWAEKYLTNSVKYRLAKQKDKYKTIAAYWIYSYQEHYSKDVVNKALNYLKTNKFIITKGFTQKENKMNKLPITAIISAYNEGDIIYHVIKELVEQEIQVYFIDHNSTDNTVEQVAKFLGRGVIKIEKFPQDSGLEVPDGIYSWRYILKRKEDISQMLGEGWYIHADADEFREAPWNSLSLREGIEKVNLEGYNAINFKIYDFKPVDLHFEEGKDVRDFLKYYSAKIHPYNNFQIKAWKNFGQSINLWESGGHNIQFLGRKVYPMPFILRHYSIRSQAHGIKKIFNERKNRYDKAEREAQWHQHYDHIENSDYNLISDKSDLILYDREKVCKDIQSGKYNFTEKVNEVETTGEHYYDFPRPEVQALVNPKSKRILDIGCAGGRMASELKNKFDAEVWGIEYMEEPANRAASKLDKVIIGKVEDAILRLPGKKFDSIIMADVLEHLENPYKVLEDLKSKLSDKGEIIISVPNVNHWSVFKPLLAGEWEYQDAGILDRTHLRFFTRNSLIKMVLNAGYEILDMKATKLGEFNLSNESLSALKKDGIDVSRLNEHLNYYQFLIKASAIKIGKTTSIVVAVFNQLDYTRQYIDSLLKNTAGDFELIIVDNNSERELIEYLNELGEKDSRIKIIYNKENLGFPVAINQGIRQAQGDYILIANNDIVLTKDWLSRMIEVAESDPKIGIVGPISNMVSGIQLDRDAKYNSIEEMHKYAKKVVEKNKGQTLEFPRVAFLCTLIKREVIDKIGGLDERFSPGNFEDDDFCLRAQIAGYKTVIAKDVFIHHYGSKSFKADGEKKYLERLEINKKIFVDKWGANPEEIWLENKGIPKRNVSYPINQNLFTQSFERAMTLLEDKDFSQALVELENSVENFESIDRGLYPALMKIDLLNLIGNTVLQLGDYEKAHQSFEEELKLNPTSSRACAGLAETFLASGMLNEAKTMFEWALKYQPEDEKLFSRLVELNEKIGLDSFNFSLYEEDNTIQKIQDSEDYINSGNLIEAEKILLEILSNSPADIDALNNLSAVYILSKNYKEAVAKLERVFAIDPSNEIAAENLQHLNSILE